MEYKLRAECKSDVDQFIEAAKGKVSSYALLKDQIFPDVELTFTTGLSKDEITSLLETITDSHVMIQTLELSSDYTGKRKYR